MKRFRCFLGLALMAFSARAQPAPVLADPATGALSRPTATVLFGNAANSAAIAAGLGYSGGVVPVSKGGLGADNSAATGVPLFAAGVVTITSTNGSGNFLRALGTVAVATGKTFTASNTLTLTGTDGSTLAVGSGGTLGTGAFQPQTVITGTSGQISVSNGGVGATTLSLPSALTSINSITTVSGQPFTVTSDTATLHASALNAFNVAAGITPFAELEVDSTSTSSPRGIMSAQFNTGTDGARLHFRKARGTRASPTTIVTGDNIGRLVGTGYDGTSYLEMASIYFASEGTVATNRVPTNIQFWTATDASPSVLTLAGKFDSAQKLTLQGALAVAGATTLSSLSSAALSNLTVGTGTFGTSITFASATGIPTFATHVVIEGVTSTGATGTGNFAFSASPTFTGTVNVAAITASGSILGSGGTAPTNTTSGSNQFTAGIATGGPLYVGGTTTLQAQLTVQSQILATNTTLTSVFGAGTSREPLQVTGANTNDTIFHLTNTSTNGLDWQLRSTGQIGSGGASAGDLSFYSPTLSAYGFKISGAGNIAAAGTLTTAAGVAYNFGADVAGVTTTFVATEYLTVVVNGSTKKIALVTSVP